MEEFDFQKGGKINGNWFPALKPLDRAVSKPGGVGGWACVYQPGNGTRYEVAFVEANFGVDSQTWMVVGNFRKAMIVPGRLDPEIDLGYMQEKLEMTAGDCYALIPLVNRYLETSFQ